MHQFARLGALALMLAPVGALAQTQAYYHAGAWEAFSGRNPKGGATCGVASINPIDNRRLSITFDIGGDDTAFSVSKPNWAIPDNTRIAVVMQVGLNTPWIEQGAGRNAAIEWVLGRGAIQSFDRQFRDAPSMTITFPDGNEQPWQVSLSGSTAISDAFGRCVRDLTRQVQATQPQTDGASSSQSATQPFSAPPAQ